MSSQKGGSVETLEPTPPLNPPLHWYKYAEMPHIYMHNVSHIVLVSGGQGMVLMMHGCERRIRT